MFFEVYFNEVPVKNVNTISLKRPSPAPDLIKKGSVI